ncbi:VOC family protein [Marisediminicola senii]|uniref:VOC family protein n=1 Tax=Marisediminicola senii TaxID=2711233 RepID=UPI0013ECEE6A|nr:VOC family protein [Marisediminicola senii]
MDMRIELIFVPVTDVDRAIDFYVTNAGFELDIDVRVDENTRFVQLTPPGSACSIAIGEGITDMVPGSMRGIQVVVENALQARTALMARGVAASEVEVLTWGSFTYFSDPDGNTWAVQELPPAGSYDSLESESMATPSS